MDNYKKLLELIKNKYKRVIVSGPQRSGTTYMSDILSKDLGYTNYDEMTFVVSDYNKFYSLLEKENIVIQAPGLTHLLDEIFQKETLIIFMQRADEDIILSEDRINWHPYHSKKEFNKYKKKYIDYINKIDEFERASPMKKWFWENIQKTNMKCDFLDIPYDITKQTSGYIEKEARKKFRSKQIK